MWWTPTESLWLRYTLRQPRWAGELGISVTGSELIGLLPARHLRAAARGFCWETDYEKEMDTAVMVLGLDDLEPFNWRDRVLEEVLRAAERRGHPSR